MGYEKQAFFFYLANRSFGSFKNNDTVASCESQQRQLVLFKRRDLTRSMNKNSLAKTAFKKTIKLKLNWRNFKHRFFFQFIK